MVLGALRDICCSCSIFCEKVLYAEILWLVIRCY